MQEIKGFFDQAVSEIERMLTTKTVVGEPIKIEGTTIIPLVNVGFGFCVGGGEGSDSEKGSGYGGGTGGGGGVKPVAIIIIDDKGVRVERISAGTASVLEKAVDAVAKVAATQAEKSSDTDGEAADDD
jgi:uncharacterized spore protein YtfJ